MTVQELIDELKNCDPNLPVRIPQYPNTSTSVTGIDGYEGGGIFYDPATGDTTDYEADEKLPPTAVQCILICWGD